MEEAKREVAEFVDYLKSPSRYTNLGARIPKAFVLVSVHSIFQKLYSRNFVQFY